MNYGYCLNYAGCKGKTIIETIIEGNSIALTMRDVKPMWRHCRRREKHLYCLNYAGCKESIGGGCDCYIDMYCLNYAGCKGLNCNSHAANADSIALTMRDVKEQSPSLKSTQSLVLP